MNQKYQIPKNLGNKYFLLFSFMTIFLFLIIIIIQTFLTQFLIQKSETDIILGKLQENRETLNRFIDYQVTLTQKTAFFMDNNPFLPKSYVEEQDTTGTIRFFYYTEQEIVNEQIEWAWLNDQIKAWNIYTNEQLTHLIAVDYPMTYSIVFKKIVKNYQYNLLVSIAILNNKQLGPYNSIQIIDVLNPDRNTPKWMIEFYNKHKDRVTENISYQLYPASIDKFYYFTLLQDYHRQFIIIASNQYNREVNVFFTKSYIVMTALLFVSLVILIITFGKWFSVEMLKPIKHLADQMQHIAENPTDIRLLPQQPQGEIQLIMNIYNQMAASILDYQFSLIQYKSLFDQSQIGFFWLDQELKIKLYNPEFLRIFEIRENPINQSITEIIPLNTNLFKKDHKIIFNDLEMWVEGLKKYVSITLQYLEISEQSVFIGMVSDITVQRQLKESKKSLEMELIRINRLAELGKRIQGIVHNLNSPMNSILGYAQFIKEDYPENTDIEKIIASAKSMSQTIKGLLTKIKKDALASPDLVNLNDFIKLEIDNYKHHLFFKNEVKLELELAEKLPPLLCTYGDLSQVFNVIFNNAIDAMVNSETKKIAVHTFKEEEYIGFEIIDSGCGISKDNISKIFEPNFTTKELSFSGGFGLGLAIANSIVKKIQGKIEVDSRIGKGSTFRVYFKINQNIEPSSEISDDLKNELPEEV